MSKPKHRRPKSPVRREPVALSGLTVLVSWVAAHFGFDLDADTASVVAAVVLVVGTILARQFVTPVGEPGDDTP